MNIVLGALHSLRVQVESKRRVVGLRPTADPAHAHRARSPALIEGRKSLNRVDAITAHLNAAVEGHDTQDGDVHVDARDHSQNGDAHVGAEGHSPDAQARPRSAAHGARTATRAKQSIPPALRRAVLRRDHECCQVPGCSHATFLDLHHVDLRSEGGLHELENVITLCGAHHRAAHRGELLITGSALRTHVKDGRVHENALAGFDAALTRWGRGETRHELQARGTSATNPHFRHADGSEYGLAERPHSIEAQTQVFSALRHLGFRERDVHAVLGELRKQNDLRDASSERLLREALQKLAPPRVKPIRS